MDEFQHRLIVALERLSGREGATAFEFAASRLDVFEKQLGELVMVLEDIRDRLPANPSDDA